jgi:hypothetical protein
MRQGGDPRRERKRWRRSAGASLREETSAVPRGGSVTVKDDLESRTLFRRLLRRRAVLACIYRGALGRRRFGWRIVP